MRINHLHLKNFGPIREIELQPMGGVVGVIGPNGQGKTHVMKALKLLFTGDTEDPINTYVRHGEKRADLLVNFTINGLEGEIQRAITPTTSRVLFKWEGKEYTKVAPVVSLLEDIFATDKASIQNVVFRPQGQLNDLLFGGDAAREMLFSGLLGVDFSKSLQILLTKANVLKGQFSDLSSVLSQALESRDAADARVKETQKELDALPAFDEATYQKLTQQRDAYHEFDRARRNLQSAVSQIEEALTEEKSLEAVEPEREALVNESNTLQVERDELQGSLSLKQTLNQAFENILTLRSRLFSKEADRKSTMALREPLGERPNLEAVGKRIKDLTDVLDKVTLYTSAKEKLPRLQEVLAAAVKEQDKVEAEKAAATKQKERAERIGTDLANLYRMRQSINKARQEQGKTEKDPTCPQCGLMFTLDSIQKLSDEWMENTKTQIRDLSKEVNEANHELTRCEEVLPELVRKTNNARLDLQRAEKDLSTLREFCKDLDQVALEQDLQKAREEYDSLSQRQEQIITLESELRTLDTAIDELESDLRTAVAKVGYSKEEIDRVYRLDFTAMRNTAAQELKTAQDRMVAITERQGAIRSRLASTEPAYTRLRAVRAQRTVYEGTRNRAKESMAEAWKAMGEANLTEDALQQLEAQLDTLEDQRSKRNTLKEVLAERLRAYNDEVTRVRKINASMAKDKTLRDAAGHIEEARQLLHRTGLPGIYLRERFVHIAEMTQLYLDQMASDFACFPDEESIRFLILDPDKDPDHLHPMTKLSGGQRVRLSIAFMLAASELLIPGVKFLTLDEPSTHLDSAGVDSLITMLETLSSQLEGDEHQVWVVDHNPEFERAFSDVVVLGG